MALNGLGELVRGTQLRWSMVHPDAGSVGASGIFVAGITPGVYLESIKVEAVAPGEQGFVRAADFASVVIREPQPLQRLDSVRMAPESIVLSLNGRSVFTVAAVDKLGDPVGELIVTWEMVRDGVGEIDSIGGFVATGKPVIYRDSVMATVKQEVDGETVTRTATADVTIPGKLSQIRIHPTLATIGAGRVVHFGLTGEDENGVRLSSLVVIWSVVDKEIGTIDAFGNFTAGEAAGAYQDAIQAKVTQIYPIPK